MKHAFQDFHCLGAIGSLPHGCYPTARLAEGNDHNLYGTTTEGGAGPNASGTIFRLTLRDKE